MTVESQSLAGLPIKKLFKQNTWQTPVMFGIRYILSGIDSHSVDFLSCIRHKAGETGYCLIWSPLYLNFLRRKAFGYTNREFKTTAFYISNYFSNPNIVYTNKLLKNKSNRTLQQSMVGLSGNNVSYQILNASMINFLKINSFEFYRTRYGLDNKYYFYNKHIILSSPTFINNWFYQKGSIQSTRLRNTNKTTNTNNTTYLTQNLNNKFSEYIGTYIKKVTIYDNSKKYEIYTTLDFNEKFLHSIYNSSKYIISQLLKSNTYPTQKIDIKQINIKKANSFNIVNTKSQVFKKAGSILNKAEILMKKKQFDFKELEKDKMIYCYSTNTRSQVFTNVGKAIPNPAKRNFEQQSRTKLNENNHHEIESNININTISDYVYRQILNRTQAERERTGLY